MRRFDRSRIINNHLVYRSCLDIARKPIIIRIPGENDQSRYEKRVMHLCGKCGLPVCYELLGLKEKSYWKPSSEISLGMRQHPVYVLDNSVTSRIGEGLQRPPMEHKSNDTPEDS